MARPLSQFRCRSENLRPAASWCAIHPIESFVNDVGEGHSLIECWSLNSG